MQNFKKFVQKLHFCRLLRIKGRGIFRTTFRLHLKWSFFAKILKAVNHFCESSILDVWLGSKCAYGGLCTEELVIAPVV